MQYGDTFITYMFGVKFFWVFSPSGVQSLYKIRESEASFTEATRGLLSLKLPAEITQAGTMSKFHRALKRSMLANYIPHINTVLDDVFQRLGQKGEFEVFSQLKKIIHPVGFLSWIGADALQPKYLNRLIENFEALDPEVCDLYPDI